MDGPPDLGGRNLGVRPMEMLLLGLGGCTQFDVLMILRRALHAHPCPLHRDGPRPEAEAGGARHRAQR